MQCFLVTLVRKRSASEIRVPRDCGSKPTSSRMMARIWLRPFFGGMNFSIRSEKKMQEGRAVFFGDVGQETQRFRNTGPPRLRLEADQFADDGQDMAAPLFRGDEFLDPVGEEDAAHLVVVLRGREGQHGGDFGLQVFLQAVRGAEHPGAADIHQEHHRQLALLFVDLDVGRARAGRDVPVDVAHVVAGAVFAHFGKRHAASPEGRVILSGEDFVGKPPGFDLDLADSFQDIVFGLLHYCIFN